MASPMLRFPGRVCGMPGCKEMLMPHVVRAKPPLA